MQSVRQTRECGDPVRLFGDDLFAFAGMALPLRRVASADEDLAPVREYRDGRSGWTVYARVDATSPPSARQHRDDGQLFLGLPDHDGPTHLVSPRCIAFMNATILGVLRKSRQEWLAAARLQQQGVLYFGDLTRMSFAELVARLGAQCRQADTIAIKMTQMGLAFNSSPTWWKRPRRFYERAY